VIEESVQPPGRETGRELGRELRVAVYCSSSVTIKPENLDLAFEVGSQIAARGWELVWGGGKISMMGAIAQGARSAGGATLGVIPTKLRNVEFFDDEASEIFEVKDMRQRKGKIEELADAFIALPGGLGTLEELFEIWVGRFLNFHQKPIAVIDPLDSYRSLGRLIEDLKEENFIKPGQEELVFWSKNIADALDYLEKESTLSSRSPL
jgi:uncharacterized protein (TIGR00730 family)